MSDPTVTVQNIGKCYRIYPDAQARIKELVCLGKKKFHEEKWAVRGVNFDLYPGQALGIIGFNGAGKSTLLKVLTGSSRQTEGHYKMRGRVSSLLELGAGFHAEFSGRENIYMNAALQGVSKKDVDKQFDTIAAFSELGEYMNRPVRIYSSGMAMRLGFSASMLVNPDILILDEVLAVGDIHFQKKCMDQFNAFRKQDKTILFVSHSVYHIREICDRCIWIHDGKVLMDGDPIEVTDEFETRMLEWQRIQYGSVDTRIDGGLASIERCELLGPKGDEAARREFATRSTLRVRFHYKNPETHRGVYPGVVFNRNDGLMVFSSRPPKPIMSKTVDNDWTMTIPELRLLAGDYTVSLYLTDDTGAHIIDQNLLAFRFKVTHKGFEKGVFLHDSRWDPAGL
jgi:ABC-type polysaccharide/polyol phosphate transport system ATPase subunit